MSRRRRKKQSKAESLLESFFAFILGCGIVISLLKKGIWFLKQHSNIVGIILLGLFLIALVFGLIVVMRAMAHRILGKKNPDSCVRKTSDIQTELYNIDCMTGREFEFWCASLLENLGYRDVQVTPASNDQGADIIAFDGENRCAFQCKRYDSDLGNTPVQEVYAAKAMYGCSVAYVLTNSHFTVGARQLAEATDVI